MVHKISVINGISHPLKPRIIAYQTILEFAAIR